MHNVTIKYYDSGSVTHLWGGQGNCSKCKEFGPLEAHHIRTRSKGGTKTVRLCRKCHDWVGKNPDKANKLGLYKKGYGEDI
jgi:5-methylcytosine-specific restriction endonuclease McrA